MEGSAMCAVPAVRGRWPALASMLPARCCRSPARPFGQPVTILPSKYRQENSLIVFERGHKAHGYVQTADVFLLANRPPYNLLRGTIHRHPLQRTGPEERQP